MRNAIPKIRPEDLAAELGDVKDHFRCNAVQIAAGYVIAGLAAGAGLLLLILMIVSPSSVGNMTVGILWTCLFLAFAVSVTLYLRWIASGEIRICAQGFAVIRAGRATVFRWDQLADVRECVIAKGNRCRTFAAEPTSVCDEFIAIRTDGEKFRFNRVTVDRFKHCLALVNIELKAHDIPWLHHEVPSSND